MLQGIWAAFDGTPVGRNDRLRLFSRHAFGRTSYAHNGYSCTTRFALDLLQIQYIPTQQATGNGSLDTRRVGKVVWKRESNTRCANDKHTEKPSRVESRLIRFGGNREIGFCWLLPLRFETEQWLFDSDRWNVSFTTRLLCHDAHAPRGHVTNDEISTAPLELPSRQVLI